MSTLDSLALDQRGVTDLIEKIYEKYKRESYPRRTVTYTTSKLNEVNSYWDDFQKRHGEILEFEQEEPYHLYFTEDYFNKVKSLVERIQKELKQRLQDLKQGDSLMSETSSATGGQTKIFTTKTAQVNTSDSIESIFSIPITSFANTNTTWSQRSSSQGFTGNVAGGGTQKVRSAADFTLQAGGGTTNESRVKRQEFRLTSLRRSISEVMSNNDQQSKTYSEYKRWALNDLWSKCFSLQEEISSSSTLSNCELEFLESRQYEELEELYQAALLHLYERENNTSNGRIADENSIRIPRINIPNFDGNLRNWTSFHDLFLRIIHENKKLSKTEKLQFLRTHVKSEAESVIKHLDITENNYDMAWTLLCNRFNNRRLNFATQMDILLNQPKLTTESAFGIKKMHDTTKECMHSISNLHINTEHWGFFVTHILREKLDKDSLKLYENSIKNPREIQTLEEFLTFLETRFQSMEISQSKSHQCQPQSKQSNKQNSSRYSSSYKTYHALSEVVCVVCKEQHTIHSCTQFLDMNNQQKLNLVKKEKLCINCLGKNHEAVKCTSKLSCRICHKRHNTKLHEAYVPRKINRSGPSTSSSATTEVNNVEAHLAAHNTKEVLLATALIKVHNHEHQEIVRALIDQGSKATFITEEAVQRLRLQKRRTDVTVTGIGGVEADRISGMVHLSISPRFASAYHISTTALVMKKLTKHIPEKNIDVSKFEHLKQLVLADPTYNKSGPVDVLLGAEVLGDIILSGVLKGQPQSPTAQQTEFGWILSGGINQSNAISKSITSLITNTDMNQQLQKFWELETIQNIQSFSEDDKNCEKYFEENHTRNTDGTYTVKIPFKFDKLDLGESKGKAWARLLQMERKFKTNKQFAIEYKKFMDEYIKLGHMVKVSSTQSLNEKYYLPHHAVIKHDSSTTKLRVVFDASSVTSKNISLNDVMHVGPRLQQDLLHILIRWRKHRVVIKGDIEKMYRQIRINEQHQDYQRILWRSSENQPVSEYALTTVTYGTASAPYLAIKTMQQLAKDEQQKYPIAARTVLRDFYVDDLMSGANSIREAKILQKDIVQLLQSGGFNLRKWSSNRPELIQDLPSESVEQAFFNSTEDHSIKTLGVHWRPTQDMFIFKVVIPTLKKVTKRTVLSAIASIFDPMGLLAPLTLTAKLFMQQLWLEENSWDTPLNERLVKQWLQFSDELPEVQQIKINRWIGYSSTSRIELHGFCDASEKAYAAAVYSRSISESGKIQTTLICAKTKLAQPKIKTTIPRLELCGAVLLANLMKQVIIAMEIPEVNVQVWTDSMIILAWIRGNPQKWNCFVANRVSQICEILQPAKWNYVKSEENPADIASRGISASQLRTNKMWWSGPDWLSTEIDINVKSINPTTDLEMKRQKTLTLAIETSEKNLFCSLVAKYSSYIKLQKVVAWCLRFINNSRKKCNRDIYELSVEEIKNARFVIIHIVQAQEFKEEIKSLQTKKQVAKSSRLATFAPFLDENRIIRVGGRLENAEMSYNNKHPIILPYKHGLTKLVIEDAHKAILHGGRESTLAYLRQEYWIIHDISAVKQQLYQCIICRRQNAKGSEQIMGSLPKCRVTKTAPFNSCGVDYAGPIELRMSKGRGSKLYKGYIAVFVCLVTKAIHLEVVSDLTAQGFLAAFSRFCGRRGVVSRIYSDNGTNFVAANKIIQLNNKQEEKTFNQTICSELLKVGTSWHFNPPGAPHFGGMWEAGVKCVKTRLKKIVKDSHLTFEELSTLLVKIEACLNSRPICALNDDPESLDFLTPGHFLIGRPLVSPPGEDLLEANVNLLTRWQHIELRTQQFWNKWSTTYLSNLQHRPKWMKRHANLKVGDLVLIKDEQLPPTKWALARITDTHPNKKDEMTRVATLKIANGKFIQRPVTKLCLLPKSEENDEARSGDNEEVLPDENHNQMDQPKVLDTESHIVANVAITNFVSKTKGRKRRIQPVNSIWSTPETQTRLEKYARIKTSRHNQPSTFGQIVLTTMMVLTALNVVASEYSIVYPQPGIYIENLGNAQLKRGVFKVMLNFSKESFVNDNRTIETTFNQLTKLCKETNKMSTEIHCTELLNHLKDVKMDLAKDIEVLSKKWNDRSKRGVLGSVMQFIFGVNDEVYSDIKSLSENQHHLIQTANHQTSIMLSTMASLNETEIKITNKLNTFTKKLNQGLKVIDDMQSIWVSVDVNKLNIHIISAYQLAANYFEELRRKYDNLIRALANHSTIFEFLTLDNIQELLNKAKTSLPSSLTISKIPEAKIEVVESSEDILINGYFNIIEYSRYNLVKATSIPIHVQNNTYTALQVSANILAIEYNSQLYFEMTEDELASCDQSGTEIFCKPSVVRNIDTSPNCIIDEMYNRHMAHQCPEMQFEVVSVIWKRLYMKNTWMFIAHTPTNAGIHCNGKLTEVVLNGTGIIKLSQDCYVQTKKNILKAEIMSELAVKSTYVKPVFLNISAVKWSQHKTTFTDEPVLQMSDQFISQPTLDASNMQMQLARHSWSSIAIHGLSGIIGSISTVGIIFTIYWIKQRRKYQMKPTPTPRKLTPQDFSVNLTPGENVQDAEHN